MSLHKAARSYPSYVQGLPALARHSAEPDPRPDLVAARPPQRQAPEESVIQRAEHLLLLLVLKRLRSALQQARGDGIGTRYSSPGPLVERLVRYGETKGRVIRDRLRTPAAEKLLDYAPRGLGQVERR